MKQGNIYSPFSSSREESVGGSTTVTLLLSESVLPSLLPSSAILSVTSRFQAMPSLLHWEALIISLYLRLTSSLLFLRSHAIVFIALLPLSFLLPFVSMSVCHLQFQGHFFFHIHCYLQTARAFKFIVKCICAFQEFPLLFLVSFLYLKKFSFWFALMNH